MNAFNYFKKIGDDKTIIFSRSIIASMVFSFFGIKNFLEIHHQNSGLTNIIFKLFRLTKYYSLGNTNNESRSHTAES